MIDISAKNTASKHFSAEQAVAFGLEIDALRDKTMAKIGKEDADYIKGVLRTVRRSEIMGRGLLMTMGWLPPAWLAGTALLSFSKIVENMELGHNVMHGQFDWMNDPKFMGSNYDWDNTCAAPLWRHYHNYVHHTYTNVIGKDFDIGYNLVRMFPERDWNPHDIFNSAKTVALAFMFQWGVGYHDIQVSAEMYKDDPNYKQIMREKITSMFKKMRRQLTKDYIFFPVLSTVNAIPALGGALVANGARNVWSFTIIFCGHFTADAEVFEDNVDNETRAEWYIRQIKGSSNITGSRFFHFMSGNLSHQIEHHLFPDMPANRYQQIAPEVKALCEKYDLNYNTGNFKQQFGEVLTRIVKYSFPSKADWRNYKSRRKNTKHHGSDGAVASARKSVQALLGR